MNALPSLFDSSSLGSGQRTEFSLHSVERLLFKHGMLIAFCFIAVTAAVAYGLKRLPPTYISTAKVLVKLQEGGTPSFYSGVAAVRDAADTQESANRSMETEMEIAETWPISAEVVTALGLKYDQVYHPPQVHLLQLLSDLYYEYVVPLLGLSPDPERRGYADTVEAFRNSLEVKPIESKSGDTNSNIIVLELRGVDPELTRRALDELVKAFLQYNKRTSLEAGRWAQQLIAQRAEAAVNEVSEAQFRVEAFLADQVTTAHNSADLFADGRKTDTLAGSESDGRALSATPHGLQTKHAAALGPERSMLKPSNSEGGTRYWLMVDRLKSRLQQLQLELFNPRKANPAPSEQTRALESEISSLTGQLDNVQRQNASHEATLKGLERDLLLKESELVDLRKRLAQITLFVDMNESGANNRVVVEPPLRARSPEWKRRFIVGLAGAAGGLFLGFALGGVRESFDTRIQTAADARASLGLPVLGVFPRVGPNVVRAGFKIFPPGSGSGEEDERSG